MNWSQEEYRPLQPDVMPPPVAPSRRPRIPVAALAAGAVLVVGLGVGIPVALLVSGGRAGAPAPPPASAPAEPAPAPAPADPVESSPTTPSPTPVPVGSGPTGLSPAQQDLWDAMAMGGVDGSSCRGYPAGEAVTGRVVASLECTVLDSSFDQPIVYYQFPDADAVEEYLALRASEVDQPGDCSAGGESDGDWNSGGAPLGRLVCIYNTKDGTTYFKMVWSSYRDDTVVVVQGRSASATFAWWYDLGGEQFYS